MKKKTLLFLSISSMLLVGCNQTNNSSSSELNSSSESSSSSLSSSTPENITGVGSKEDPYVIYTSDQFLSFVSNYERQENLQYYKLANDIDLNGTVINPIGDFNNPFYGVLNGNGKKISNFSLSPYNKMKSDYGLFGYAIESYIYNLKVEFDYDFTILGADTDVYIGGLVGYAENVSLSNISVKGSIDAVSGQNTGSTLVVGGIVGYAVASNGYYVDILRSESKVNINCDLTDAADTTNITGGIVGAISTGYGQGAYSISSSYYEGDIYAEDAAGGILGVCTYFTSVVDCFVNAGKIETYSASDASYAGGIMAQSYYETAALNNLVVFESIKANQVDGIAYYDSMAGTIVGYAYKDAYEEGTDLRGYTSYKNYYVGENVTADVPTLNGTKAENVNEDTFKNDVGLSSNWDLSSNYPTLNKDYVAGEVSVTLNDNNGGSENEVVKTQAGSFDSELVAKVTNKVLTRKNYSFNGFYYDENKQAPYCFYAPILKDTVLYAGWTDLSSFIGNYDYVNDFGTAGKWKFTETTFYWVYDMETFVYSYTFDGKYIFIGEGTGGYEDQIFIYNEDGTITGYDVNDYSYAYHGTKTNVDLEIVDYTDNKILGVWYSSNGAIVDLYANGNVSAITTTSSVAYSGGFRLNGSIVKISSWGRISGTFTYDEEKQIMFNDSMFVSRDPFVGSYVTQTGDLSVYVTEKSTYVFINGELTNNIINGELTDGSEVTINGTEYVVSGSTLIAKSDIPVTFVTYVDSNKNELVIRSNETGSFNGVEFTFDSQTGAVSPFGAFDGSNNTIVFNDDETVTLTISDEYNENSYSAKFSIKVEEDDEDEETPITSLYGTYKCGNGNTLVLNEDGTGTWNEYSFTWNENNLTISTFAGFDGENYFSVNNDGTLSVHVSDEYGDNVYNGTFIRQEEKSNKYGSYSSGSIVITLNEDGSGSYFDGTNSYNITWDETSGSVSNFGPFTDDINTVTFNDNGTISLYLCGDYGDNQVTLTMSKVA